MISHSKSDREQMLSINSQPIGSSGKPRAKRRRRILVVGCIAFITMCISLELFCRYYLGLGDPPLLMADPDIEYLFKPSRTYHRFGNRIKYNAYSMRSDEFAPQKSDPREFRVLVLGDSVINGGALTDQASLATEILKAELSSRLGRPVIVGNVSASSWGPPNLLAYTQQFGFFEADVVALVLSSHDAADRPTGNPVVGIRADFPEHSPWLALQEAVTRYIPWLLRGIVKYASGDRPDRPALDGENIDACMRALRSVIVEAWRSGAVVVVLQYPELQEVSGSMRAGFYEIRRLVTDMGIESLDLRPAILASIERGDWPYRDPIHPNDIGQRVIAECLVSAVLSAIGTESGSPWPRP